MRNKIISSATLHQKIFIIRGVKVMLDKHLAELYGVSTKQLNQSVKRNIMRFPSDFMFQLNDDEMDSLRSQFVTANRRGGSRVRHYVFTEQGVAMLSSVIRSVRAVAVNIAIMRVFVQLRNYLTSHRTLARKIQDMERSIDSHDRKITMVFDAIRQLASPERKKRYRVGF